jgi:hypothetical protein
MKIYTSIKSKGLEITITPDQMDRDKFGRVVKTAGHKIKFKNGSFRTDKKDEIEFLKDYMEKYGKGKIFVLDEAVLKKQELIRKKAAELVDAELKKAREKADAAAKAEADAEKVKADKIEAAKIEAEKVAKEKEEADKKAAEEADAKQAEADEKNKDNPDAGDPEAESEEK